MDKGEKQMVRSKKSEAYSLQLTTYSLSQSSLERLSHTVPACRQAGETPSGVDFRACRNRPSGLLLTGLKTRCYRQDKNVLPIGSKFEQRTTSHSSLFTDSGLTLLELLISVSILAIFASTVAGLFFTGLNAYSNTKDEADLTRQAMYVMERIVSKVRITKFSMMPRAIVNITDFLAISGGIDNDNDGRIDEDTSADITNDGQAGIIGIDDDGDGDIDNGTWQDDAEGGVTNSDKYDEIDNDGNLDIDEDPGADMNNDGYPGIKGFDDNDLGWIDNGAVNDDDEDGTVDEDPVDTLIYYYDAPTKTIKEKLRNGVTGSTTDVTIAQNVEQFQVQYVYDPVTTKTGPMLIITLSMKDSKGRQINLYEQVYPRNIVEKDGEKVQ